MYKINDYVSINDYVLVHVQIYELRYHLKSLLRGQIISGLTLTESDTSDMCDESVLSNTYHICIMNKIDSGCMSGYKVITTSLYIIAQKDMHLH